MTKTERLFHIVNYLRVKKSASIEELTDECGVSSRTVYRDVLNLEDMSIVGKGKKGWELNVSRSGGYNMTADEAAIILFSLGTTPLVDLPYFKAKVKNIGLRIQKAFSLGDRDPFSDNVARLENKTGTPAARKSIPASAKHIEAYWKFMNGNRRVKVSVKRPGKRNADSIIAFPEGLGHSGGKWWFELYDRDADKKHRIDVAKVTAVVPFRRK